MDDPVTSLLTSSHWGIGVVKAKDGKIVSVEGHPSDPDPSSLNHNIPGGLSGSARVLRPAVRANWLEGKRGERGRDPFVEVSWDEALDLISAELKRVRKDHGNEAFFAGSYSATLKTWQVGRSAVENLNLRPVAAPWLDYLSEQTGETIYLAVRNGLEVIYIDKRESLKAIRSWNPIGGTAPIYCVGTGKALLAADYANLRPRLPEVLHAHTDRTLTDLAALDADMEAVRLRGHAVDRGEFRPKIYSYGGVIRLPDGSAAGALGVSVPNINLEEGDSERIGALVQHAATAVSEALERL